jgi:DNA invertase Pin-like site-specific DNA recombinase
MMTVRLMAVIAEGESDKISDRTKRSMAMAKKNGRQFGGIRYKLQRDANGEIVARMRRAIRSGRMRSRRVLQKPLPRPTRSSRRKSASSLPILLRSFEACRRPA